MNIKSPGSQFQLPSGDIQDDKQDKLPHISKSSFDNESNRKYPASPKLSNLVLSVLPEASAPKVSLMFGRNISGSMLQMSESAEHRQEMAVANNIDVENGFNCHALNNLLNPFENVKTVGMSDKGFSQKVRRPALSGKATDYSNKVDPFAEKSEADPFADIQTKTACLYYESTMCLQSCLHGHFLSTTSDVHASNKAPVTNSRVKLTQKLGIRDCSVIKYGDLLYIQVDKKRVIGTSYIGFETSLNTETRVFEGETVFPVLIKTTNVNNLSDQHFSNFNSFSRWRILNKNRQQESIGEMVYNKDEVPCDESILWSLIYT